MTTANLIAGLQILQKYTGGPEWHGFAANDGKVVACCDTWSVEKEDKARLTKLGWFISEQHRAWAARV